MFLYFCSSCDVYIEPLDSTRVHPENYEWARKMAEDALDYDEVNSISILSLVSQLSLCVVSHAIDILTCLTE